MNAWYWQVGLAIATTVVIVGLGWLIADRIDKWQVKRRNEERPTATPITGETRVNMPVSTARFEKAFNRAIELSADKLRKEMREMEIELEVKRTYTVKISEAEMKRLTTILDLWYSGQTALSSAASSGLRDFARDFGAIVENAERV